MYFTLKNTLIKYSRGNEHAGGADELQLGPLDGHVTEEAVDVVHGEVDRLLVQLVLLAHLHQPVHQDGAHRVRYVRLLDHVLRRDIKGQIKVELIFQAAHNLET